MSRKEVSETFRRRTGAGLFNEEERLLAEAEQMMLQLNEMSDGLQQLTTAHYRRAIKEQKRMVRVSDRLQSELRDTKVRLEGEVKAREKLAEEFVSSPRRTRLQARPRGAISSTSPVKRSTNERRA